MNVEEWLRELYASHKNPLRASNKNITYSDVPSYEKVKVTNQILADLQEVNQAADLQADEEIRLMKIHIQEHSAETARLTNILSSLELDLNNLPDELKRVIHIVSQANQQVQELEEPTEISNKITDITVYQTQALQQLQNLEKVQESLNQMNIDVNHEHLARKKETEFLSKKISEYATHVRHLEKKLEAVEYNPEIGHGSLEKRSKELTLASEKLSQLRCKLDVYSDLTPDLNLAKIQVQNVKDELKQLESQITDNISKLNSN